ncbi:MAG: NAD-dependent deacylase [Acidobacteria bacterium]|nr:NAD-dependent deacylase [Acidobacteriota bacterium]
MNIEEARGRIAAAQRIVALTGSGISAESGIPTFRGPGGLWRNFRPEDLATPQAFRRDPQLVWEWYDWRRSLIAQANPNAGHIALAELEQRTPSFTLVTQNVDGLHARAGSVNVVRLHGDIWTLRCTRCERSWEDMRASLDPLPPICECGAMARPGVVWFGEPLPTREWNIAAQASHQSEVFLIIGTSAVVQPAASLAGVAQDAGAIVIEVNAAQTEISDWVDCHLEGNASEILPLLLAP